ncbi:IS66 family insertion sequence hypothetical protein [Mesorhizobium sp. WSM3879]|uniref:transposase n=1 Tax=Mesorhizobium sp. WSM3879 TaxID=2029406 RepID=UPI000BAFA4FE|nr:transposase [Mesorhizobium sp. WSM3879]PBB82019.1 IS66 family insertion sequence hypothetical protein [Mesorhizobium sp. WSM3879]
MSEKQFLQDTTLEVLTTRRGRREAHRQWPDEVKAQIVSEGLRPGVTVNEVAERHGLEGNHLSSWRTLARQGNLVLPAPEDAVEFAAMIIDTSTPQPPTAKQTSRAEIVVGPVTIRLDEGASAARRRALPGDRDDQCRWLPT